MSADEFSGLKMAGARVPMPRWRPHVCSCATTFINMGKRTDFEILFKNPPSEHPPPPTSPTKQVSQ